MHRGNNRFVAGVDAFVHTDRNRSHEAWQSNELVRETSMAVFLIRVPDHFCLDDVLLVHRIVPEEGK